MSTQLFIASEMDNSAHNGIIQKTAATVFA